MPIFNFGTISCLYKFCEVICTTIRNKKYQWIWQYSNKTSFYNIFVRCDYLFVRCDRIFKGKIIVKRGMSYVKRHMTIKYTTKADQKVKLIRSA